ncbi:MAG: flavodoxin domain-containing protein [Thermoplasmata archaeon]|nr:flavodoxin domain-containing protein [Thermoplasmata archaeon]
MKVAVAFDSIHGNTARVAEGIAKEARALGHSVEMIPLRNARPNSVDAQLLFVGGPTRFGRMTHRVSAFVKRLDRPYWAEHPVVAFDTFGPTGDAPESEWANVNWLVPGAAGRIQELARTRGLLVLPQSIRARVTGLKGPLAPEALESTHQSSREILLAATASPKAPTAPTTGGAPIPA